MSHTSYPDRVWEPSEEGWTSRAATPDDWRYRVQQSVLIDPRADTASKKAARKVLEAMEKARQEQAA